MPRIIPSIRHLRSLVNHYAQCLKSNQCPASLAGESLEERVSLCAHCRIQYCSVNCATADADKHKLVCKILSKKQTTDLSDSFCFAIKKICQQIPLEEVPTFSRVRVFSEEIGFADSLKEMERAPRKGNLVIGVQSLSNLDICASRKDVDYLLVVDLSTDEVIFWDNVLEIIKTSDDKEDCKNDLIAHMRSHYEKFYHRSNAIDIRDSVNPRVYVDRYIESLRVSTNWLEEDEKYNKIKKMCLEGKIAFIPFDFKNLEICEKIQEVVHQKQLVLDTFFISSKINKLPIHQIPRFKQCFDKLYSRDAFFMRSSIDPFFMTKKCSALCTERSLEEVSVFYHFYFNNQIRKDQKSTLVITEGAMHPFLEMASRGISPVDFLYQSGLDLDFYTSEDALRVQCLVDMTIADKKDASAVLYKTMEIYTNKEDIEEKVFDIAKEKALDIASRICYKGVRLNVLRQLR